MEALQSVSEIKIRTDKITYDKKSKVLAVEIPGFTFIGNYKKNTRISIVLDDISKVLSEKGINIGKDNVHFVDQNSLQRLHGNTKLKSLLKIKEKPIEVLAAATVGPPKKDKKKVTPTKTADMVATVAETKAIIAPEPDIVERRRTGVVDFDFAEKEKQMMEEVSKLDEEVSRLEDTFGESAITYEAEEEALEEAGEILGDFDESKPIDKREVYKGKAVAPKRRISTFEDVDDSFDERELAKEKAAPLPPPLEPPAPGGPPGAPPPSPPAGGPPVPLKPKAKAPAGPPTSGPPGAAPAAPAPAAGGAMRSSLREEMMDELTRLKEEKKSEAMDDITTEAAPKPTEYNINMGLQYYSVMMEKKSYLFYVYFSHQELKIKDEEGKTVYTTTIKIVTKKKEPPVIDLRIEGEGFEVHPLSGRVEVKKNAVNPPIMIFSAMPTKSGRLKKKGESERRFLNVYIDFEGKTISHSILSIIVQPKFFKLNLGPLSFNINKGTAIAISTASIILTVLLLIFSILTLDPSSVTGVDVITGFLPGIGSLLFVVIFIYTLLKGVYPLKQQFSGLLNFDGGGMEK